MVLFFIYPGINKKTKINAHELEALRFILRFLLTRYERTENTHIGRGEPRHHSGRQGRAGGRAGCTLCGCGWLRACTHAPCEHQLLAVRRADERSGPDISIFGSRLAFKSSLLQTGASSVCVCAIRYACAIIRYACASSDMHVTSSDMHVPSSVIYMYSSVPGHRNWQIETAAWIWPSIYMYTYIYQPLRQEASALPQPLDLKA